MEHSCKIKKILFGHLESMKDVFLNFLSNIIFVRSGREIDFRKRKRCPNAKPHNEKCYLKLILHILDVEYFMYVLKTDMYCNLRVMHGQLEQDAEHNYFLFSRIIIGEPSLCNYDCAWRRGIMVTGSARNPPEDGENTHK